MAVLDVAKKSLEVILVFGCSLMLFSFEGCVFDVRATVFAPVFGLRDRVSAIGKRRYRDMSNTRDRTYRGLPIFRHAFVVDLEGNKT